MRDGIWLTSENLKEIYDGLKVDQDGNGKDLTDITVCQAHYNPAYICVLNMSVFHRSPESRGVQVSEERRLSAFSDAAWSGEEPACEEQQTHLALPRPGSTSGSSRPPQKVSTFHPRLC